MSQDRARNEVEYRGIFAASQLAGGADVPGLLAGRIGDLYAQEERRRRAQRTERMIQRAQSIK